MRYFYTCPIRAAYQAKEFDVKFLDPTLDEYARDGKWNAFFDYFPTCMEDEVIYLHPDCQDQIPPRVGDYGGDGKYSGFVTTITESCIYITTQSVVEYCILKKDFILEKRNNKPWFEPEREV